MATVGWGPYQNGQVPLEALLEIPGEPGDYNHASAVVAWIALRADCYAATGYWLSVTEAYRDLAGQQLAYQRYLEGGPIASIPGNSNHGRAIAFDIGGYSQPGVWAWLRANAGNYGFSWATGQASNEDWHWEYVGALSLASNGGSPLDQEAGKTMFYYIFEGYGVVLGAGYIWLNPDPTDADVRASFGSPRLKTDDAGKISRVLQSFGIPGDYSVFTDMKKHLTPAGIPARRF